MLLSLAVANDLDVEQLDVKTTFLHGELVGTIYMKQNEGYIDKNSPDKVCL